MFRLQNFIFIVFFLQWAHLWALEKLAIPREDQSYIEAYLSTPQQTEPFPLIILIQGSDAESVLGNHTTLAERFNPHGIALLSSEKRGISAQGKDPQQFIEYDFFEYRLLDYLTILSSLEKGMLTKWNGKLIILGGSEGGKIAPRLALQFSSLTNGLILVGSGNGIPFGEEMKFQIEASLNNLNLVYKFCFKIRDLLIPRKIDEQYIKILEQPQSLELWHSKTFRWWASFLKYNPLPEMLEMKAPIFMIHGALDSKIPIESADAVKKAFDEDAKYNLTYARYADLEHSLKGREDVYLAMISWIKTVFQK